MTPQTDYILNHREFVILGLIAEFPSHAYSINQRIDERGMRAWTSIGKSSIYNDLNNLKKRGFVDSYNEEVDNRIRKVYTITASGNKILKNKVQKVLRGFIGRNDEDFYVAFSMLPLLTEKEQINDISASLNNIKRHKRELEKMLKQSSHMPLNVRGLFFHPIKILETNISFLEWVLKEIREGKGQDGTKLRDR